MKLNDIIKIKKGETQEHLLDRSFQLLVDWKENIKGVKGDYLIFPLPHYKKEFNQQDKDEQISYEEFQHRLRNLPTEKEVIECQAIQTDSLSRNSQTPTEQNHTTSLQNKTAEKTAD